MACVSFARSPMSDQKFGAAIPRIAWLQRAPEYVRYTILTVALLFAQFFGASSDSLEHFFQLPLLLGRDILKCTFDESGVLAEDRNEYSAPLLRKRNSVNAAIALALHTTDQPLLIEPIDCHAHRSRVEVHLRAQGVNRHRPFVQENVKDPEIRVPQALLENGRESKATYRL